MPREINQTRPSRPGLNATFSKNPILIPDLFFFPTPITVHYSFIYIFTQHILNEHLLCAQNTTQEKVAQRMNKVIFITLVWLSG